MKNFDWSKVDYIIGTREDLVGAGRKRPCASCGCDVYLSAVMDYPADVPVVCADCATNSAN